MSTQKVLVTGGAGFIGTHTVVELIAAGFEPIIVDDLSRSDAILLRGIEKITSRKIPFYKIDCLNSSEMQSVFSKHPDISHVIHFAAFKSVNESVNNPLLYYRNNLGSLEVLLDLMKKNGTNRLIFSSSCTVYGQPDQIPVTEESPFKHAESAYGASKQMCERILEDHVKATPELKVISLRYFNPIGAHPSGMIGELPIGVPTNLVPFITQTAIGKREKLIVFGDDYSTPDGSCLRDFIHVVDLAKAHVRALEVSESVSNRFDAINIGSGEPVSVLQLLNAFIKISGVNLNYAIGPRRAGDVEKIYADSTKSFNVLKWKTKFGIEEALRDAWNWEKNLKNAAY